MKNKNDNLVIVINKSGMYANDQLNLLLEEKNARKRHKHANVTYSNNYFWETKDKKYIKLHDMTNQHLDKIIYRLDAINKYIPYKTRFKLGKDE